MAGVQRLENKLAFDELRRAGYVPLLRDYECPEGYVDIIAKEGGNLVFIGVNRRPFEFDTLERAARYYTKRYGLTEQVIARFDNVRVFWPDHKKDCKIEIDRRVR